MASALGAVVAEANSEKSRGEAWIEEERRSSFSGVLLLKPHEAVVDGGVVAGTAAAKPWGRARRWPPLSVGARRGPGRLCSDRETDGWAPRGFYFFQFVHNRFKFKNSKCVAYLAPKFPNFSFGRLGYYEQFSKLCQHPITNITIDENPGSDSTFESLMNFKMGLNLLKKSSKFPKILSWLDLHKSEFSWDHLYARMWVTIQVPNSVVWIK
jgi:hypothetical protein